MDVELADGGGWEWAIEKFRGPGAEVLCEGMAMAG